jgi:two-component system phosphate regulon sensor histidine kinase PhoR
VRLNIRAKLFLAIFVIIAIVLAATALVLSRTLENYLISNVEDELSGQAKIARVAVEAAPSVTDIQSADPLADRIGRASSSRVTIILDDGEVIGDSELSAEEVQKVENHAGRSEVRDALATGFGKTQRWSATLDCDMLYIAVRYERSDSLGVVRVSEPLSQISQVVARFRGLLAIAGAIALAIALVVSAASSHLFSRTLRVLVEFARQMAEGEKRGQLKVASPDELGGLAGSLNKLSEQLERHVSALAGERDRFEAVLEGMSEAVLALDERQKVTLINRAGIMLLGLSGQPVGRMLAEMIRVPSLQELVTAVEPGNDLTAEFDLPSEPARRILARATRPRVGGVVVVLLDVTELRRLENIRRDFVSNVSHELRTPVSIIRANAETLLDGAIDDRDAAERFLGSLISNAERLANLIADLLDISRIEEGKYNINIEPVPLAISLRRAAASLETQAIEKNFTIQVEPMGDLSVIGDARALDQVLYNLVDNAVKHNKSGGKVILRALKNNGRIRIEVEDDGPGVDPKHRTRLFERFYRVDPGRSRKMGGTGLGLAIVKHLVLAMNGEVGVEPAQPHGSIFWISLPA